MNLLNQKKLGWFQRILLIGVGLFLAAKTSSSIVYEDFWVLLGVTLLLAVFNVVLKPMFVLLAFPFVVLTMGLGLWVINAVLLMIASKMIQGFAVNSFGGALWGAFLISLVSAVVPLLFKRRERTSITIQTQVASVQESITDRYKHNNSRVIDI